MWEPVAVVSQSACDAGTGGHYVDGEVERWVFEGLRLTLRREEAEGYYIDFGWYIPGTDWELDVRYDSYTRGENHPANAHDPEENAHRIRDHPHWPCAESHCRPQPAAFCAAYPDPAMHPGWHHPASPVPPATAD